MGGHFLCIFVCRSEGYVCGSQMTTSDAGFHLPPYLKQDRFFDWKSLSQPLWLESELRLFLSLPPILKHEYWDHRCMILCPDLNGCWGLKLRSSYVDGEPTPQLPQEWFLAEKEKKAGMHWRRGIGHTRVSTKNDKGLNATIRLRWGG